ncbi:MAG: hypothetical protein JJU02_09480 [Cryomorphaceae bacterium]|nr:hypothetical protein [Cryomorphaceae bacterium]
MLKPVLLFLTVLTCNLSHAQTNSILTYELINDKIASDSLSFYGFKMFWKSTTIWKEEILELKDSVHFRTTLIVDSNENELYRYQSWYGDSLRREPISLNDTELLQLSKTSTEKKWRRKKIDKTVQFTRSDEKKEGKRFFKISRPIFFDEQQQAILTFYLVNENAERYFIQVYKRDDTGKWILVYKYLAWV